ncbi:MAG: tetratricopeptide repeat protein [Gemmatimonadaceae bacterium]
MTTPISPAKRRLGADEDSMYEWLMLHRSQVTWSVLVVLAAIAVFWFFQRQKAIKAERAETQFFQARQAAAAGNLPLAISDLQKVATRYDGTRAGTQASLSLAQAYYDQKKYKEGIDALKKAESKAPADFKPSVHVLEADGYEELRNFVAAAEQYKLAAAATSFPAEKAQYQSAAARNYMSAGKNTEAKAIWTELAKDETGPEAAEARVRLGEVAAKAMSL